MKILVCQTLAGTMLAATVPDSIGWSKARAEGFDGVLSHLKFPWALTVILTDGP